MSDDLVKRLRSMHWCVTTEANGVGVSDRNVALEAADCIEALTAERDRLRVALEDIADHDTGATAGLAYTAKIALKGETP